MRVTIFGAGIAGLTCAVELAERGVSVEVVEIAAAMGAHACSWYAGGMLAPWCERERAEPLIGQLGQQSLQWWLQRFPGTVQNGSLVLAARRDLGELARFAQRTENFKRLFAADMAAVELDLTGRFDTGLWFPEEAHIDPRAALKFLAQRLVELGGRLRFNADLHDTEASPVKIDCTGLAAREVLTDLRGVKGEMLLLRTKEIQLRRPVRLLHPRAPVYIVPRGDGVFMIGATMIESDDARQVTARSVMQLLNAAYTVHPAFAEAEILEMGTQVRPAFPDNLPRVRWRNDRLYVNGLYRHGFLIAPALAQRVADYLLHDQLDPEVMDADHRQRRLA